MAILQGLQKVKKMQVLKHVLLCKICDAMQETSDFSDVFWLQL